MSQVKDTNIEPGRVLARWPGERTEDRCDLVSFVLISFKKVPKLAVTVSSISAINLNYLFTAMLEWSFFWTIYKETEHISIHYQKYLILSGIVTIIPLYHYLGLTSLIFILS